VVVVNADAAPLTAARKKRGRWVVVGAVVALLAVVGVVAAMTLGRPSGSATSNVSTATAAKRTITVAVSGTGSAVAADAVTVNPQISGEVEKLYVSLGASVSAGDKLYTISSSDVENELLKAKASLLQSEQSVLNARSSYKQASSQLYTAKTQQIKAQQSVDRLKSEPTTATNHAYNLKVAKRELASAKQSVSSAKLGVSSADVGLEAARANLSSAEDSYGSAKDDADETVVTAPSDGVITALPISVGSAVSAGTNSSSSSSSGGTSSGGTAASGSSASGSSGSSSSSSSGSGSSITITDMESLQVEMSVSEVDIPKVSVGQKADVEFDAVPSKTFTGSVKSIMPNAASSSGVVNYTVYVKLDSLEPTLRTGMTASVDIRTTVATDALAVPSSAVKTDNGTKYVMVVGAGGTTSKKTVTVGVSDDSYTQILSGITDGTVVSTGSAAAASGSSTTGSSTKSSNGGAFMMGGPGAGGGTGGPPPGGN
jgi:multidrug efflux pump subunit AcrA (membrane-fusion protein)